MKITYTTEPNRPLRTWWDGFRWRAEWVSDRARYLIVSRERITNRDQDGKTPRFAFDLFRRMRARHSWVP